MDLRLFRALNSLAGRWDVLDAIVRSIAGHAAVAFPVALVLAWVIPGHDRARGRAAVVLGALAMVGAFGVNQLVGRIVERSRPFVEHRVTQLIPHARDSSFPSDHTAAALGAASGLWLERKRIGTLLAALGLALGISRVIAGIHYPGDVAGGALIGIACAAALWVFLHAPIEAAARAGDRAYEALRSPFRRVR